MRTWSSTQHRVCLVNIFVYVIASRVLPVITTFSNWKMLPKEMLLLFVLYTNVNWQIDCNGDDILYSREKRNSASKFAVPEELHKNIEYKTRAGLN
jgi:hypothetical protein